MIDVVGIDADDTLWHSEGYFLRTERRYRELVERYVPDGVDVAQVLAQVEHRNMGRYGYGIKAFTLSMLEAAIEATDGSIGVDELAEILAAGRSMLDHPVDLLPGVDDTVTALVAAGYRLAIVTKGDLYHQQHKIMSSGLADRFERLEIVAHKDPETYRRVVADLGVAPERFAMVGNSVPSDVLPVLAIGGHAAHIPYHSTWDHEQVDHDILITTLATFADLPNWLATL